MKNGFSLIELLAVLVVLGIILGLVVVNVNYFSNSRRNKDYDNLVKLIEENTSVLVNTNDEVYVAVNEKLQSEYSECKILYSRLVEEKLIDKETKNPKTMNLFNNNSYVKVILNSDSDYEYKFIDIDNSEGNEYVQNCLSN